MNDSSNVRSHFLHLHISFSDSPANFLIYEFKVFDGVLSQANITAEANVCDELNATMSPTKRPTQAPSGQPTVAPSGAPSATPTKVYSCVDWGTGTKENRFNFDLFLITGAL